MIRQLKNWEFGALNIYNYKKPGTLKNYFDFVKNNHTDLEGDLLVWSISGKIINLNGSNVKRD